MGVGNLELDDVSYSSDAIIVNEITNLDNFDKLEMTWNGLLSESSCEHACLHWKWMQLWWTHFSQPDYQPLILLFHQADRLIGIFPLVVMPRKGRVSKQRVLYFFGTGENEIEEITTEYIDLIVLPGFEQAVAESSVRYLTRMFTQWDRMELMRYGKSSVLQQYFLPALQSAGIRQYQAISGFRHYLPLVNNYDAYVAQRSRSFRRSLKNRSNRLKELGQLEVHAITTVDEIDKYLDILRNMHIRRFEHLTAVSAFISQRFTHYHRDLMRWLFDNNRLLFLVYVLDGKVISAEYTFIFNKTVYAYQGSFDLDFKRMSLGFLSINEAIRAAIMRGADTFDFMMGGESHYASSYGCERDAIHTCYAFNRSIKSRLAFYRLVAKKSIKEMLVMSKEALSIVKLMM